MTSFERAADRVVSALNHLGAGLLAVMTFITVLEVVRRYFFSLSFPWAEESVRYMLVWLTFIGGAAAYRSCGIAFFDLLTCRLTGTKARATSLASNSLVLALLAFAFNRVVIAMRSPAVTKASSATLGIPMWVVYLGIAIGLGLMIVFSLDNYRTILQSTQNREAKQ